MIPEIFAKHNSQPLEKNKKIKVYLYTRVYMSMQIDGYSLDAQKTRMKAFCEFNEYEIAGEYEEM